VVAAAVGVHRVTVTRWRLYHAEFRAALEWRREQVWDGAANRVRQLMGHAVTVMGRNLEHPDPLTSIRVAKDLLGMAHKFKPPEVSADPVALLEQHAKLLKIERARAEIAEKRNEQ
jgi:hypothetical protein